ncbi:MAG: hypothetical protein OEM02_09585 [Desulfobulbaceae bacterium]|nr:hypothetical protein [Desulfobulbaceae bacterium]
MTFSCKNHDFDTDNCKKLNGRCIMGRRGCILEGKVTVSEDNQKLIDELEKQWGARKKRKKIK